MIVRNIFEINRRLFHDLWNIADVTSQPNGLSPRLILPKKRNEEIRYSEQEARFLYCSLLNSLNYFYSVETPTEQTYIQKGQKPISAASDLSLYVIGDKGFKKVANIEFKAQNPPIEHIKKDIEKLIKEGIVGNWFHLLKNIDSATIPSLFGKLINSFRIFENIASAINVSIVFSICVLEKKWACSKFFSHEPGAGDFEKYVDEFFKLKYVVKQGKIEVIDDAGWDIIQGETDGGAT